MQVCAEGGSLAVPIGVRILRASIRSLDNQPVSTDDLRGLILGFHAKALEELIAMRAALREGSLGSAIAGIRVLFEIFVNQAYILQGDSEEKARAYRRGSLEHSIKDARGRALSGDEYGQYRELLHTFIKLREPDTVDAKINWAGKSVLQMAQDIGLKHIYVSLYRSASWMVHARDADSYNPLSIFVLKEFPSEQPFEQPYFLTEYSLWSARDAIVIGSYLDTIPICLFGNTADFLNIKMTETERSVVEIQSRSIRQDEDEALKDLRESLPEIFS
jgi:hypothetical protein